MKPVPTIQEYYDRINGIYGIGSFYNITSLDQLKPGDKVISIEQNKHLLKHEDVNCRRQYWLGVICSNKKLPILLTVKQLSPPYHVLMERGYGSIAFDLLYKENE